jgi:transporter family-2 protein
LSILIALALLNGALIATSRAINGHLGRKVGPIRASLWNHAVGFLFLTLFAVATLRSEIARASAAPPTAWLGGLLGVAFVALNSYAVPRLGAARTTSFVVGAQMLAGIGLDRVGDVRVALAGAILIIAGASMVAFARAR